jgi:hypothetical protein
VATTDIEHILITVAKYNTMVGRAVELAGIMPEMSKLNITIDSRMVISKETRFFSSFNVSTSVVHSRNVSFSPLSGGRRKPKTVMKLIKTHGTRM